MQYASYIQALILCIFSFPSLEIDFKFKPYRSALYSYKSQVFPVEGTVNTYKIYVAGEVITMEISEEIETNLQKIVEWKVFNTDENRLMFLSNNRIWILIDKRLVREMKRKQNYLFENNIIILGNNKIINGRRLDNSELEETFPDTYLDLVNFNPSKEAMEIVDSIEWKSKEKHKHDGKTVADWIIMDHIVIGNKLYIAIGRHLGKRENRYHKNSQISIMRLCLDRGDEILRSAVEIYYTKCAFAVLGNLVFKMGDLENESRRFSVATMNSVEPGHYFRYFIANYSTIFDEVATNCANGEKGYYLMHDVLRNDRKQCKVLQTYECNFPKFYIPSFKAVMRDLILEPLKMHSFIVIHDGYPVNEVRYLFTDAHNLYDCTLSQVDATISGQDDCNLMPMPSQDSKYYFNYVTSTIFWVDKTTNSFIHEPFNCTKFDNCFNCIMFGFNSKCIWNGYLCLQAYSQNIDVAPFSVKLCGEITKFKPNSVSRKTESKKISIDFTGVPWIEAVNYTIKVTIGPNPCYNITKMYSPLSKYKIVCMVDTEQTGRFPINVRFTYDHYSGTVPIVLISEKFIIFQENLLNDYGFLVFIAKFIASLTVVLVISVTALFLYCPIGSERQRRLRQRFSSGLSLRKRSMKNIKGFKGKTLSPQLKWKEFNSILVKNSSD